MEKQVVSLFLSVMMVLNMCLAFVAADTVVVEAAPVESGVILSKTELAPGDTFTVTLKVPAMTKPISDMSLKVLFDNTAFEVVLLCYS